MFLKEYENVEVILTHYTQPSRWEKSIGFKPKINESFSVHWSLLKSKSEYRIKFIKVKCDDCSEIIEKRIRDLKVDKNYHLCCKCQNKGDRNGQYGQPKTDIQKLAHEKWLKEKGNPFLWDSVKKKLRDGDKERVEKIVKKTRGQKRSPEKCLKISKGVIECYRNGKKKPGCGWNNVKVLNYKGIDYQGTYELKFLQYIEKIGKLDIIEKGPIIDYEINGVKHNYFIDFKLKNTNIVFEIKSIYTWKKAENVNTIKKQTAEKLFRYYLIMDNKFNSLENIKELK